MGIGETLIGEKVLERTDFATTFVFIQTISVRDADKRDLGR